MNKNILVGTISCLAFLGFVTSMVFVATNGLKSCSSLTESDPDDNNDDQNFNEVEQVEGAYSKFNYMDLNSSADYPVTPSKGTVNVLVVPVEFKDLTSYTTSNLELIENAFNGSNSDGTTSYWESCKSFYKKSSNGALNFNFEVTDVFIPNMTASKFNSYADDYGTESSMLLDEISKSGLTKDSAKIDLNSSKYDSNKDGYIDGIWLIYNATNYQDVYGKLKYWAYTTDYYSEANYAAPFGKYANGSILFLSESGQLPKDSTKADAHTVIHETGHMLGLDDYYDYANNNQYSYTGQLDMMDLNIGDHDAFSKYALGWTKAMVIDEKATLTLKPFATSYDSIILPSGTYNGSAFSEYIIVEYYTPEGLFKQDSESKYGGITSSYPYFFKESGLRIYHVDARLAIFNASMNFFGQISYEFGSYITDTNLTSIPGYSGTDTAASWTVISHTNSPNDTSRNKDGEALIELVSSQNETLYGKRGANDNDLYTKNKSDGYAFSATNQSKYFTNGKFNDGSEMNYVITINGTNEEGINLTIDRI